MFTNNILERARSYYLEGHTRSLDFRIEQLDKLEDIIKDNEKDIIDALRMDLGKHEMESYMTEIGTVLRAIKHTKKKIKKWAKPTKVKTPLYQFGAKSYIVSEPYGVVLIIGPFNYPFNLVLEPLIGAIAAGNTVVLKPSEQTPNVARLLKRMIEENFYSGYISVVEGGREVITSLINSSFDYIFFTGSIPVGRIVMEAASKNLVPVTLELGGKSPCIVSKNADIKLAAKRIAWGKLLNAGQTCIAPDYLVAHKDIKDELARELINCIKDFYGVTIKDSQHFGRIVSRKHALRLAEIIDSDKDKIIFGGDYDTDSCYIEPTIIDNTDWQDKSMEDEIFGPILPIQEFEDINEVINMINKREKPLALYLFSNDKSEQRLVINSTHSGGCCINDTISHIANHNLPFGGVGSSGMGSYHGRESFSTFSHKKSVLEQSTRLNLNAIFPPYNEKNLRLLKRFLK